MKLTKYIAVTNLKQLKHGMKCTYLFYDPQESDGQLVRDAKVFVSDKEISLCQNIHEGAGSIAFGYEYSYLIHYADDDSEFNSDYKECIIDLVVEKPDSEYISTREKILRKQKEAS